jgi:hypothetical protein
VVVGRLVYPDTALALPRQRKSLYDVLFFFVREEMHLRTQLPTGSWYVGLRGARRDYPLKPHGGRNMMIYEKAVWRNKSRNVLGNKKHK